MIEYIATLLINAAIFALFSLGLNLQWGFTGLVNFGHVAFMTIGAYTTVLLSLNGVPWGLAFLIASAIAGLLGVVIGSTALKLREDYLGIVTIGVSEMVRLVVNNEAWLTRGTGGVQDFPLPLVNLLDRQYYSYVLLILLLITVGIVYWRLQWLVRSPWGRVLKAIREDEEVAKALGKDVFGYKLQAFAIGGAIGGMAGAFYAWQLTTVYPDNFVPLITFQAWTIVTIGGAGSNLGVIIGAIVFQFYNALPRFLPEQIRADGGRFEAIQLILIGLTLILLMLWRPQGILGNKKELTLNR
ncbi:branched-chain amino acid ABC transporter permease [Pseudanabaena sp. FACHB-1277]|jgi:neutral amino acid transport system permease protein|uniref:Branched-chain amino acid ABC transporter permease n=1 Tax=Pseudanabaena cinerea FACHB-1277 TaxID=2949581 RepID=A0A926UU29_9CYAN|nr:branched-chain amino acid ABC transporter permease [Pseudanabaena cinerea]MBD2151064.1 branched-chain amino acid ABC transporter permease [Pseudanabaena cinerea FACHB-1277]